MINLLKTFYTQHYQRWMWYAGQTESEMVKVTRFLNTSLLLSILAKQLGFSVTIKVVILFNIIMLSIAIFVGKFLVFLGIAKYNNSLANKQSTEFMEVVKWVRSQKK